MTIKRFEFNMFPVNTYVVSDEETKEAAIIDAGCYLESEFETLKGYISSQGLKPKYLLNTHLHFDHIFGNRPVYQEYGLRTCAHPADEDWLTEAKERTRMFGLKFPGEPGFIGTYLKDGDILTLGKYTLECLHVPGHSAGSLVFYSPEVGCLFSGDALFRESVGRTDLPGGNHRVLTKAITQRLLRLPDDTVVYPGHGPSTTVGHEKQFNFYLIHS